MNLVLHILRKDAARLRRPWLAWLGLLALKISTLIAILAGSALDDRTSQILDNLDSPLGFASVLLSYLMAVWLVQADSPMNPAQTWHTRPVSPSTVLVAKVLAALLLLVIAPAVLWLPWWLYCGLGAADCLRAALTTFAEQVLIVGPAFLLASVVGPFRRILLWTPVLAGLLPALFLAAEAFGGHTWFVLGGPGVLNEFGSGLVQTRVLLAALTLAAGGALFLWMQYRWRNPRRSLAAAAGILGLVTLIVFQAPWNFWTAREAWAETSPGRAQNVSVRLDRPQFEAAASGRPACLRLYWNPESPAGVTVAPFAISYHFTWPDRTFAFRDEYPGVWSRHIDFTQSIREKIPAEGPVRPPDAETGKWIDNWFATHPRVIDSHRPDFQAIRSRVGGDETDLRRMLTDSPSLTARLELIQTETVVHRYTPVQATPWTAGDGFRLRLTRVEKEAGSVAVRGAICRPRRLIDIPLLQKLAPLADQRAQVQRQNALQFGLLDGFETADPFGPAFLDLPPESRHLPAIQWKYPGMVVGGVDLTFFHLKLEPARVRRGRSWETLPATDEWFSRVRFAVFDRRETARFEQTVTVPHLEVSLPPVPADSSHL